MEVFRLLAPIEPNSASLRKRLRHLWGTRLHQRAFIGSRGEVRHSYNFSSRPSPRHFRREITVSPFSNCFSRFLTAFSTLSACLLYCLTGKCVFMQLTTACVGICEACCCSILSNQPGEWLAHNLPGPLFLSQMPTRLIGLVRPTRYYAAKPIRVLQRSSAGLALESDNRAATSNS